MPQAVEHPRNTENPPGTPSGRRLRLETRKSPVERLFPPSGGVSRGSVRVGGETFLLPSYGFSFGYKRKGVSIVPLTKTQSNIVGQKMRVNAITGRRYNPSVFSACKTSRKASSPCTGEPRRLPPHTTDFPRCKTHTPQGGCAATARFTAPRLLECREGIFRSRRAARRRR